jgi:uncharacterized protein (TIGR03083 family)
MSDPRSKQGALGLIHAERDALESILSGIGGDRMLEPGAQGEWSVKDLLAHIVVWEQRMVRWIGEALRGETPEIAQEGFTWDDLDAMNEQSYLANKDRPLDEIQSEFRASHQEALATVAALTEDDLFDGERFAWRKGVPLLQMVAANTWYHYKEHREDLERWMTHTA